MVVSVLVTLSEKPIFCPVSKSVSKTAPTNTITNILLAVFYHLLSLIICFCFFLCPTAFEYFHEKLNSCSCITLDRRQAF